MEILLYGILLLLGLWVLGNLFTYPLQDYFIFRPRRLKPSYRYAFAAEPEEMDFDAPHGGRLNALWFRVGQNRRGVVLYFHGNTGNLARWGHFHYYFTQLGFDFFVYDYRGYGKSRGKRTEHLMYEDAKLAYQQVRQRYPGEEIVVMGRSLGSTFATRVAAEAKVKALILETPFASMKELFYNYYPFLPRVFMFKYRFFNEKHLARVQCPVYIFQGTDDWVVPYSSAAKLEKSLKPQDEFITVPGGGHNNLLFYDIYNLKMQEILDAGAESADEHSEKT